MRVAAALALAAACLCCHETKGAGPDAAAAARSDAASARDVDAAATAMAQDGQAPLATADAAPGPPLDELPDGGAGDLASRARHLLEAISQDDLSLAGDIVLPREAYLTARDAQDPGAAYDAHFKPGFEAQMRHVRRHEKGIEHAIFAGFDLGPAVARVVPKKKEWREPLWRATRATLTYTLEGKVRHLDIAEMIAWKGAWYVAKLR